MAKIYVGCALTGAPAVFVGMVETLKVKIREAGHEVARFVGLVNGTAVDVYETDIHRCVAGCDVMIALCDLPSLGLGWEMSVAVEHHKKPTLALAHRDAQVSRLPIGAQCERNPHYQFVRYDDFPHLLMVVLEFVRKQNRIAA